MYHYRKNRKVYASYPKPESCPFCDSEALKENVVADYTYCYVLPNRTFYNIWELHEVSDHLLIVPKSHCDSLGALSNEARHELIDVIATYESKGYNVYARAPGSSQKSVSHQHTHLIKTTEKPSRGSLFLRKPYLLLKF